MTSAPPDDEVLRVRELSCERAGAPALHGVSLTVRPGEVLAVTGPRGAGKSTLLGCLTGRLPFTGEVWFGDVPVHTLAPRVRERLRLERFGVVGDTPQLLPELTCWENVALPLLLTGTAPRTARRAAMVWLERLDAGDCARRRPAALPRPRQQRVAIARALVHEPAVLCADEPTAPLHTTDRTQALRALLAAARQHAITTVLTGTDAEAGAVADRTVTLTDGRLDGHAGVPGPACSLSA